MVIYLAKSMDQDKTLQQSWSKYLRQTLVFMWNSTIRKKFNFYFQEFFASIDKILILEVRLGTWLSFYEVLRFSWYFLIA